MSDGMLAALAVVIAIAAVIGLGLWIDVAICHSKADAMGMAADWGPLQGCVVEHKPGQWAPLENLRIMD